MTDDIALKVECQDALARLAWALDRGENAEAADMFTDDGVMVMPTGVVSGADVRTTLLGRPAAISTRHLVLNLIVDKVADDAARTLSHILVYRLDATTEAGKPLTLPPSPQAMGEWRVDLRKTPAGWRVSRYEAVLTATP